MSEVLNGGRPGYDPEAGALLAALPPAPLLNAETLQPLRAAYAPTSEAVQETCAALGLVYEEHTISGPRGDIEMSVVRPAAQLTGAAIYYTIHGGGMVMGNRFLTALEEFEWVAEHGMVYVTPEYRLAPEHPAPAGVEDCYAGLVWAASRAESWGADPARIVVSGTSGGGGMAAGTVLMARDDDKVEVFAQLLMCPMLDDRNTTASSQQYQGSATGMWPRENNLWAWDAILGEGHADREISAYSAPARAKDLSGLPSTFIDVGSAEVFRDECVDYASRLWAAGVQAELHIWRGGYHGFEFLGATTPLGLACRAARADWLRRTLA
ncbi:alpha/beta hydrolase fold domain-containing protein [Pseudarthrobacter scleromae]|uniref:alpha/beta hydrolase fold domain-containing protein n=1 Tax=Pseudarthrobacter scleromae TaxID=158897 RepID=UPI0036410737